jgi:hypothetical protein
MGEFEGGVEVAHKVDKGLEFVHTRPFNCQTTNVVYIIHCSLCSQLYVGEPAPFTLCKCFFYSTSFYLLYVHKLANTNKNLLRQNGSVSGLAFKMRSSAFAWQDHDLFCGEKEIKSVSTHTSIFLHTQNIATKTGLL